MTSKAVAIIGAGPSGLASAKAALEAGLSPRVFESHKSVGGLWSTEANLCRPSMRTNLSKHTSCFSDFAWPNNTPSFPAATQVGEYLAAYSERFLDPGILSLGCKVTNVERSSADDKWIITWTTEEGAKRAGFDFLIMACGFFSEPYIPSIPGLDTFPGTISHSSAYSSPDEFKDKNVVIVGGSLSSVEVADDFAIHAASVHHITPRPFWVLPKHLPLDANNPGTTFLPLDLVLYRQSRQTQEELSLQERWRRSNRYLGSISADLSSFSNATRVDMDQPPYVVISDTYTNLVRCGNITIHTGHLTSISGTSLALSPESISSLPDNITHIIFATGFRPSASSIILPPEILSSLNFDAKDTFLPLPLHRATLHPSLPNAAFVGHYRGPYWGIIELQALWCAALFSGSLPWPSIQEMQDGVAHELNLREMRPRMQWPRGDYVNFGSEFARTLGMELARVTREANSAVDAADVFGPHCFGRTKWLKGRVEREDAQGLWSTLEETLYLSATRGKFVAAAIFRALQGKWTLNRTYFSRRPEYPSGPSTGAAQFLPRPSSPSTPSTPTNDLRHEYLYTEHTTLTASNGLILNGTQQYIYQYSSLTDQIEVHFCKRDADFTLDYFFHSLEFSWREGQREWMAKGSHFCSPDQYEVEYAFWFNGADVVKFKIGYEVTGPRKDYSMTTWYTRG